MSDEERKKDNARSQAATAVKRGKLLKQPCERCGLANAQMHHEAYEKPLAVTWLCTHCHRRRHLLQEIAKSLEKRIKKVSRGTF